MARQPLLKTCRRCRERHHPRLFPNRGRYCRRCDRRLRDRRRIKALCPAELSRLRRNTNLRVRYGITTARYDELYRRQGGRCAVCKASGGLCVDHCHKTGGHAIRGLLCRSCNLALGHVRDDPRVLKALLRYLARWGRKRTKRPRY